jgi:hypothetical protein
MQSNQQRARSGHEGGAMRIANAVCVLALVCCGCGHHPQDKEKPALPFPSHAEIQADLWQKQHVDECWASWDRINESRAKEIIEGKSPDEINAPNADTRALATKCKLPYPPGKVVIEKAVGCFVGLGGNDEENYYLLSGPENRNFWVPGGKSHEDKRFQTKHYYLVSYWQFAAPLKGMDPDPYNDRTDYILTVKDLGRC